MRARSVIRYFACVLLLLPAAAIGSAAHADPVSLSSSPKTAWTQCSVANCQIVAGVTSKHIRVWSYLVQNNGSITQAVTWKSNSAGTQLTAGINVTSNAFNMRAAGTLPLFETIAGQSLYFTQANTPAQSIAVEVQYTEADDGPTTWYPLVAQSGTLNVAQSGSWNVGQSGTWNTNATVQNASPWHVTCDSGCSGGSGSLGTQSTPDVVQMVDSQHEEFKLAAGLAVAMLVGMLVRSYPRRRMPF